MSKSKIAISIACILIAVFLYAVWWEFLGKRAKNIPLLQAKTSISSDVALIVSKELKVGWAIDFLPKNKLLVTERPGQLDIIDLNNPQNKKTINIEEVHPIGEGGLLGLAIHPQFKDNHFIYLFYTYAKNEGFFNKVMRFQLVNDALINPITVIDHIPGASNHNGGRIAFGPDNHLYISTGDAQNKMSAQDLNSLSGKILRLKDDGSIPGDNPFKGLPVYSFGHRNPQGLAWDKEGKLWSTEHGPQGHDEINLIQSGKNYGWPFIVGKDTRHNMEAPIVESSNETWAPSGAAILNGKLYFGGLRSRTLYAYNLSTKELDKYLVAKFGRIREVRVSPDKLLYITTSNRDGRGLPKKEDDMIIIINPNLL